MGGFWIRYEGERSHGRSFDYESREVENEVDSGRNKVRVTRQERDVEIN